MLFGRGGGAGAGRCPVPVRVGLRSLDALVDGSPGGGGVGFAGSGGGGSDGVRRMRGGTTFGASRGTAGAFGMRSVTSLHGSSVRSSGIVTPRSVPEVGPSPSDWAISGGSSPVNV
jgi:hypothetical protein